jgi:hypothetical protein
MVENIRRQTTLTPVSLALRQLAPDDESVVAWFLDNGANLDQT